MATDIVQIRHFLKPLILILIVIGFLFFSACYATHAANAVSIRAKKITGNGGRLDWYKGVKHNLIAFDAIVDDTTKNTELYTMQPDGSDRFCVTCNAPVPKGFVGQPVWHPNGEHIIFQVENENSPHTLFNHLAWGINNDIWIIKRDGSGAELIYKTKLNHAALHPQISPDGKTIVFSARTPTGRVNPKWKNHTPGGENHWEGWSIISGKLDLTGPGTAKISNPKTLIADGALRKITGFNNGGRRYLASDFSWSKDGKAIMIQAAPFRKRLIGGYAALSPEIWLIEFVFEVR
jgi:hypothetical protein